jgi:cyanate lyase
MILSAKVSKGIKWSQVTQATGLSKEWSTAACLGQMTLDKPQAEAVGRLFGLSDEAIAWLQIVPYKGSLPTAVPTDPLIYRWYEMVNVYGTTIKELIAAIPKETTLVMIEQDMDTALDLAETVTLLHYGKVIVDGQRDAVIADEKTREVYLGH